MTGSIHRKLNILFASSVVLVLLIAVSWWNLLEKYEKAQSAISEVIEVQENVETLRSQLWVFLQFGDQESLQEVLIAQKRLSENLMETQYLDGKVDNIKKLNDGLAVLIAKETSVTSVHNLKNVVANSDIEGVVQAQDLLHSRYNMTVQNMVEELFYLQKMLLEDKAAEQKLNLVTSILKILVFAVLVCAIALMILRRFRSGCKSIRSGIAEVVNGDLDSRLKTERLDSEFVEIGNVFNQMKETLQQTTVTKEELEVEVERQVSKLKMQKEQLTFLSERDSLTELYNRRACKSLFENAIVKANRTGCKLALLFLDLDKFKAVNDTKGHDVGDELLRAVALRLRNNIRASDFAGRIGGDEFVVCLDLLESYDGVEAKATQLVDAITAPINVDGEMISIGVSIGISFFPKHTRDINDMLKFADDAMYIAKRSGSHVSFYKPEQEEEEPIS